MGTVSSLFGLRAKAAKQASSRGKQELRNLKNRLDRAERVAKGNNPKASRQAAVEKTKKQIETYGDKRNTAVSAATEFIESTFKEYMDYNEERRNE